MNKNNLPLNDFVAIDVEYANKEQSICQIGLAVVHNQVITSSRSWLVRPQGNEYDEETMRVHHLTPADTENQPSLEELWPEIQPYLFKEQLWAHNARSVEQPIMLKNLREYCIPADWLNIFDSRDLFLRPDCPSNGGNGLELCCMAMGIPFDKTQHHDAEYDALKCAEIVIAYKQGKQPNWDGVPKNSKELRKLQQEKRILHLGEYCLYYTNGEADGKDAFAEMTSTYEGAQPQIIDVYDKGDRIMEGCTIGIDFTRLDTSDGNPLRGKKVVVTGMFCFNREIIKQAIEAMGAKLVPMPTRNTDAVIIGTRNVGFKKLCAIEEQCAKGHKMAIIVGNTDLEALLYGDGKKFFE